MKNTIEVNYMKLCVLFPGVGYTIDKPLLYFSQELATAHGFTVRSVNYQDLPNIKGLADSDETKIQAFNMAISCHITVASDLYISHRCHSHLSMQNQRLAQSSPEQPIHG